jgi:hypothetical protein
LLAEMAEKKLKGLDLNPKDSSEEEELDVDKLHEQRK